jgi:hypothetical protein
MFSWNGVGLDHSRNLDTCDSTSHWSIGHDKLSLVAQPAHTLLATMEAQNQVTRLLLNEKRVNHPIEKKGD